MYRVRLSRRAERGLRGIRQGNPKGYQWIVASIRLLEDEAFPSGAVKLTGFDPPAWRLRVGQYRIVYEVYEEQVLIVGVNVAPRGEAYR